VLAPATHLLLALWLALGLAASARPAMPAVGQPAPEFALPDLEGRRVSPADYRGKVVLLNFFAYWCDTWKDELTRLKALKRQHPELSFEILFVAVDSRERSLAEPLLLREPGIHFPVAVDFKAEISQTYGITTVPTLFVLDREGIISASFQGYPGNRLLARELNRAGGPQGAKAAPLEYPELKEYLLPEELKLWRSLNQERKQRGLPELVLDTGLTEVGREYLQRTASEPLRHATGPQAPDARVRARGISFAKLGENLARSKNAALALQAMLESPSHKSNLLHPRYQKVGVSAFRDAATDGYSFCLLFLQP
jgi:peroxiredoxin